jgi:hypothetical protein
MALTIGNKTNDLWSTPAGGTSRSFSHTQNTGGNGYLIVITATDSSTTGILTVTYGGQSMTNVDTRTTTVTNTKLQTWRLANPPTGVNNVVLTCDPMFNRVGTEAISFTDCGGTGLFSFADVAGPPQSTNITISTNSVIIGIGTAGTAGTAVTIDGSSRTIDWNILLNNYFFGGLSANGLSAGSKTVQTNSSASCSAYAIEITESIFGGPTNTAIAI